MTARARVDADFERDGVSIWLGRAGDRSITVVEPVQIVMRTQAADEAYAVSEPALRLPEDLARALLDALAAHFGGVSEVQTLRKDYLAERARVDKMIDHLTREGA